MAELVSIFRTRVSCLRHYFASPAHKASMEVTTRMQIPPGADGQSKAEAETHQSCEVVHLKEECREKPKVNLTLPSASHPTGLPPS